MSRKLFTFLCTLALCFGCFAVAGCGSSTPAGSDTTATADGSVDPAEKFYGEWKLALLEYQGVYMVGNLDEFLETGGNTSLKFSNDGTGSLAILSDNWDFTWETKDDNTLTIAVKKADGLNSLTADVVYSDGAITLDLKMEDFEGKFTYTKDGTIKGYDIVNESSLTDVTSSDQLLGSWNVSGISTPDMTIYGDAQSISAISGNNVRVITFADDGTCTLNDSSVKWVIDEEGGAHLDNGSQTFELKLSSDYLVMVVRKTAGTDYLLLSKTE